MTFLPHFLHGLTEAGEDAFFAALFTDQLRDVNQNTARTQERKRNHTFMLFHRCTTALCVCVLSESMQMQEENAKELQLRLFKT